MLTVLLASHNGAPTLPRVLESYLVLQDPPGGWKVVVVDNASNDGTGELVDGFADRLPIQLIHEPRRGKNRALNAGLEFTTGDLVVFTDDDTVPRPDWLVQMRTVADQRCEYDMFGGVIEPIWLATPPDWIFQIAPLGPCFAITSDTLTDGPLEPGRVLGPNMAIRKRIFDGGHRFDEKFGPAPGQYRMGSETELTIRLSRLGYKAWHCSASRVGHIVRPHQMDPQWLIRRANRMGKCIYWRQPKPAVPHLFGMPRWVVRRLLEETVKLIAAKATGDFERSFAAAWQVQYYLGYLGEACQARRTRRSDPAVTPIGFGDARQ